MSLITFVTERLAALTARLNDIDSNAKKIDELPEQTILDKSSKIHVSRGGISEKASIETILSGVELAFYNQMLEINDITLVDNDVTIPAFAKWKINNLLYSNLVDVVKTIPYCASGLIRTDILVANTSNGFDVVTGEETSGIAVRPNIPLNTVLVTEINVTDASIGEIVTPDVSEQDNHTANLTFTLTEIGASSFTDSVQTKLAAKIAFDGYAVNAIQIYAFIVTDDVDTKIRQVYRLLNRGKGDLSDLVSGDLYLESTSENSGGDSLWEIDIEDVLKPISAENFAVSATDGVDYAGFEAKKDLPESGNIYATTNISDTETLGMFGVIASKISSLLQIPKKGVLLGYLNFVTPSLSNFILITKDEIFLNKAIIPTETTNTKILARKDGTGELIEIPLPSSSIDHFKGVYLTEAALNIAHPTANEGDYAQVNEVGATDVVNYSWDDEEEIWVMSGTGGIVTESQIATINHAASEKTTIVDADEFTGQNSVTTFGLMRVTALNIYNYLKGKFDSVYTTASYVDSQIAAASIVGTSVLINDPKIIRQGIDYRFNDFTTYTNTGGTATLSAGLNILQTSTISFINTGKIIDKSVYSITLTGTCTVNNVSFFGFGLKNGSLFHSIAYRGSTGEVTGFQYGINTAISTPNGGGYRGPSTGPGYNAGDVVSVRIFLENDFCLWQCAVNGVWQSLETAHTKAFKNLGELVLLVRTASTWSNVGIVVQTKAEYAETVYIAPSGIGLDTNDGTSLYPKYNVGEALNLTKGVGKIIAKNGDYFDMPISFRRNLNIQADDAARVRFIYGERITSAAFTSGSTKVYEIPHAAMSGTAAWIWLWQHDVKDPLSLITDDQRESWHRGKTHRLESMKSTYLSSVALLEASDPTRSYWYQAGGKLYFTIVNGTNLTDNPLVIPNRDTTKFIAYGNKGSQIKLKGIQFLYNSVDLDYTNFKIEDCATLYSHGAFAWHFGYCKNSIFIRCQAGGVTDLQGIVGDGFNAHADTGISGLNVKNHTVALIDCWVHDVVDDGISWHQFTEASLDGCLVEYSGSGITPASGAHGIIKNSYVRNCNLTGFYTAGAPLDGDSSTTATYINCLAENNGDNYKNDNISTVRSKLWNCVAKGTGGGFGDAGMIDINCVVLP